MKKSKIENIIKLLNNYESYPKVEAFKAVNSIYDIDKKELDLIYSNWRNNYIKQKKEHLKNELDSKI